jgi:hypothetical protein
MGVSVVELLGDLFVAHSIFIVGAQIFNCRLRRSYFEQHEENSAPKSQILPSHNNQKSLSSLSHIHSPTSHPSSIPQLHHYYISNISN